MTLIAYHNDESLKTTVLKKMRQHREADQLVQNYGYWQDGKGCAVGCLLENGNHEEYESRFGIPQMLAHLEDTIFENLPVEVARKWPERFLGAIRPGADLSLIGWAFLRDMLRNIVIPDSADADVQATILVCRSSVEQCAELMALYATGQTDESAAWSAESAAWSARSAARSAAWSAGSAARSAAESAGSAAESAAWSARSAVWSARSAARSAAWSAAESAGSAAWSAAESAGSAAWSAARSAGYERMADMLIALMELP